MILIWNVRGAAGREFGLTLKEIRHKAKPKIVVLLETRCSGTTASKVIKRWGFKHQVVEEARGCRVVYGSCGMMMTLKFTFWRRLPNSFTVVYMG